MEQGLKVSDYFGRGLKVKGVAFFLEHGLKVKGVVFFGTWSESVGFFLEEGLKVSDFIGRGSESVRFF